MTDRIPDHEVAAGPQGWSNPKPHRASSNRADEPTTECCGTHIDDGTCFWCGKAVDAVGRVIPKSAAEGEYGGTEIAEHIDKTLDATPNSVSITVSEETADWITAKAMEHGCTEDEVIATLIADWNEATDA